MSTESNVHANDAHSLRIAIDPTIPFDGGRHRGVGGLFPAIGVPLRDPCTHSTMIFKIFENFLKYAGKMIHSDRRISPRRRTG
jgi:hypothetical protein